LDKILVWDFPTRAFHWILVFAIAFSVYTGLDGGFKEMDYHMYSGYLILSLIIFRIAWGFLSKGNARFSRFIVSPQKIIAYLRDTASNEPKNPETENYPGHNPLGGLSVLALLAILLLQATTGLFANDDIFVEGPLTHLVSEEISNLLTTIHHFSAMCLGGLIALHLSAIVCHEIILKHKIVMPMITGRKIINKGGEDGEENLKTKQNTIAQLPELFMALILIISAMSLVYAIVTYL